MAALQLPSSRYKVSFLQAVREYQAEGLPQYVSLNVADLENNFVQYVQNLLSEARGENLPPGYVPHTVFWLVEGNEFLGRVDIRHELNDTLHQVGGHIGYDIRPTQRRRGFGNLALELGIKKAKELGIDTLLVTCDVGNLGSNKIIRKNGGQLEDVRDGTNRYWIAVK